MKAKSFSSKFTRRLDCDIRLIKQNFEIVCQI